MRGIVASLISIEYVFFQLILLPIPNELEKGTTKNKLLQLLPLFFFLTSLLEYKCFTMVSLFFDKSL